MLDIIWLNLIELSKLEPFKDLLEAVKIKKIKMFPFITYCKVVSNDKAWKVWCDTEYPEEEEVPCNLGKGLTIFLKLLLIRSWCPDRTLAQAKKYVADSLSAEFLETRNLDLEAGYNHY